jgi:DNA ligase-1
VVAYDPDTGDPLPFQRLSERIKRVYEVERMTEAVPVGVHCFDLLSLDGEAYLDRPLRERIAALDGILEPIPGDFQRVEHRRTSDPERAEAFYEAALDASQEGVMVKNLAADYQPGRRVGYMMKCKRTMEPLDLTVVRAKWSEGRRSDNLGRLYLGCRDPETGAFREVGRLSTGFTDDELAAMTARLEPQIREQDGREVDLEPSEVIEVAYEEIQASPAYASGYALRFPRFEGFRDDLDLTDVDTCERVAALYEDQ